MATIPELLNGHVSLEVECLDRLYLNGYIGGLATPGGLVTFMRVQLGKPIPSPVVLELLRGAPTYSRGIPVELVTPSGAAILASSRRAVMSARSRERPRRRKRHASSWLIVESVTP